MKSKLKYQSLSKLESPFEYNMKLPLNMTPSLQQVSRNIVNQAAVI